MCHNSGGGCIWSSWGGQAQLRGERAKRAVAMVSLPGPWGRAPAGVGEGAGAMRSRVYVGANGSITLDLQSWKSLGGVSSGSVCVWGGRPPRAEDTWCQYILL